MGIKYWTVACSLLVAGVIISFTKPEHSNLVNEEYVEINSADEQDWNQCVQKAESEWGGSCLNYGFSEEKYTVYLVNTCDNVVDLMSCVQRTNEHWSCFYRIDMKKNDTLHAYACQGSGKYLKWVRKAGDVTTKFPTRDQVNEQY